MLQAPQESPRLRVCPADLLRSPRPHAGGPRAASSASDIINHIITIIHINIIVIIIITISFVFFFVFYH